MPGHTLVIPTYNRPALVRRLARYYRERAPDLSLLVLDSSRPEVAQENARALAPNGGSLRHVVFPGDIGVAAKLARGLAAVETPYVSFCADDDLVFPQGLRQALAFLEAHPDYSCAHGLYLNFREAGRDIHIMREYAGPGIEAAHPGARIFRLLQKYESLFYAAFRPQDLRDIFAVVPSLPTLHYQELFQSVAALIKGKVRRFPAIYAARQSCAPAEPERDKWQTYYWFAGNPAEVLADFQAYRGELWKFYEEHGPAPRLDQDAFYRVVDLSHAVYFSTGCPPEYFYSTLQQYWPADAYEKLGPLEVLRWVENQSPLKWAKSAGEKPAVDLFDLLKGGAGSPWRALDRPWAALWCGWLIARSAPALVSVDREARNSCRTPWKCRLPIELRWLAGASEFRTAYRELCRYLDAS